MRDQISAGLAALVLSVSLAAPVGARPSEDAEAAYARGNYATGLRLWRPLADQGDIRGHFSLGCMYPSRGVPRDDAEAVKWYRKGADQGDAIAQFFMGGTYDNGLGVPQDYVHCVRVVHPRQFGACAPRPCGPEPRPRRCQDDPGTDCRGRAARP